MLAIETLVDAGTDGLQAPAHRVECTGCGSVFFVRDFRTMDLFCSVCGLVREQDATNLGCEARLSCSAREEGSAHLRRPGAFRVQAPGLTTRISGTNRDANGRSLPARNRLQVERMRRIQRSRLSTHAERRLNYASAVLDQVASKMGLPPHVRETALTLFRGAVGRNLLRGSSIRRVGVACLYASCRRCRFPRTLTEFARVTGLTRRDIGRTFRTLKLALPATEAHEYIGRFCLELELPGEVRTQASAILRLVAQSSLMSGRGPTGLAAAALYIAAGEWGQPRSQRAVSEVAGVSEVTLRTRYAELAEKLGLRALPLPPAKGQNS